MHVAEFTLHAKPGHFEQVAEIYSEFAANFLSDHPALESVLILGDEAEGVVRGIGVFSDREGADELFAGANDDDLFGEEGVDGLDGGPGLDHLFGGPRNDELFGGADEDDLDGGPDSDECQQGTGTGTVLNCEADLVVDVVGPATAPAGNITYTVNVTNLGPSSVGYTLVLDQNNSNLQCSGARGTQSEPELAAGLARSQIQVVTCVDEEAPGGQLSVGATVSGPPDPTPENNHDVVATTVSG
jgi:Ca2+-binding RTX toxin-like protein